MARDGLGPLAFEPILRRLVWGGQRLGTLLGKSIGEGDDYAESWEIADHGEAVSRIASGPYAGRSLRDLIAERGPELLGPGVEPHDAFPLLIKFLDAHQTLSLQVHPDDALAAELLGDRGKTEAWVILYAEPGALIYAGLRPGVDRLRLQRALSAGEVEPLLHRFPARAGDCIFIPAGTVHAIGAGVVLAEVQQMSDATFRLHDWGRLGPDGRPRALHVVESLRVTDFHRGPVDPVKPVTESETWGSTERLVECPYFAIRRLKLMGTGRVGSFHHFTILIGLEGVARIRGEGGFARLEMGRTLLLPASGGEYEIKGEPSATLLIVEPGRDRE